MNSFKELDEAKGVSAVDLKRVLQSYAKTGAAIKGKVVVAIINRTNLTDEDKQKLLKSARLGVQVHEKMYEPREVREYQMVVDRLA